MVSIDLDNHLTDDFDITLIVSSEITGPCVYHLDSRIKVVSLGISHEIMRADQYLERYKIEKKHGKKFKLLCKLFNAYTFRRGHYKRVVKKLIKSEPGVLISSAGESYYYTPRGVKAIFHYHFNSRLFFTAGNKGIMALSRKPDYSVFLSKMYLYYINVIAKERSMLFYYTFRTVSTIKNRLLLYF